MLCVWRAPNGEPTWHAVMENERRTRRMLAQANLEHHPAMRPKPTTDAPTHRAADAVAANVHFPSERARRAMANSRQTDHGRGRDD